VFQNAALQARTAIPALAVTPADKTAGAVFSPPPRAGEPTPAAMPEKAAAAAADTAAAQNNAPAARTDAAAVWNGTTDIAAAVAQNGAPAVREDAAAAGAGAAIPAGADKAARDAQEPAALLKRLMSLFADVKDKEALPAQLKQVIHELPAQLKELKHSLQTADNIDRNTLGQRAELLDRQFSMMADIKRFDCYHVPLSANGNPATAELYVFRQRRQKTEEQPDSYAVLLGLDTQHMGRVEAMIRATGRSVALEFRLEQAALAEAFAEGAKRLEPLVAQAGYRLGDISVRALETKTTVLSAEETLTEGRAADTGGLDIRI
jgi:hypothetical protein